MSVLVYLVPIALGLGLTGLVAFVWSVRSGQYDDLDGAAVRVLSDDDLEPSAAARRGAASSLRPVDRPGEPSPPDGGTTA